MSKGMIISLALVLCSLASGCAELWPEEEPVSPWEQAIAGNPVTAIGLNAHRRPVATIRGKAYQTGDRVLLWHDGKRYTFEILAIHDHSITLRPRGADAKEWETFWSPLVEQE